MASNKLKEWNHNHKHKDSHGTHYVLSKVPSPSKIRTPARLWAVPRRYHTRLNGVHERAQLIRRFLHVYNTGLQPALLDRSVRILSSLRRTSLPRRLLSSLLCCGWYRACLESMRLEIPRGFKKRIFENQIWQHCIMRSFLLDTKINYNEFSFSWKDKKKKTTFKVQTSPQHSDF